MHLDKYKFEYIESVLMQRYFFSKIYQVYFLSKPFLDHSYRFLGVSLRVGLPASRGRQVRFNLFVRASQKGFLPVGAGRSASIPNAKSDL